MRWKLKPIQSLLVISGLCCHSPSAEEIPLLTRGVNLSHWFSQTRLPDYPPNAVTAQEMQLIRSLGLDHVRLPLDPIHLWDFSKRADMNRGMLRKVDAAIELAIQYDLNVVVDMHPRPDLKARIDTDPETFRSFVNFWSRLAEHLSGYYSTRVALEILNEPLVKDLDHWQEMVTQLHTAIREKAPAHTIIIGGGEWSDVFMLRKLKPVDDPNTIYTFHFYEPHLFTHQGARWGSPEWLVYTNVPYPMPPQVGTNMAEGVANPAIREAMLNHIDQDWNAEKIESRIKLAADWAEEHGTTVWCGEFGAYMRHMAPEDRARYIRDVRTSLENHGIGWAVWDLKGSFSLLEKESDPPEADASIAAALGLPTENTK